MFTLFRSGTLLLVLALVHGCGTSTSAPTQDQVKRDCDQIAASTIYVDYPKEAPMLLCSEVKILGTSVDGKAAQVLADVTVKYALDARLGNLKDTSGFYGWMRGKDWSDWDAFKSTRPRQGDTRLYRVTFKYRQFDTGWRLEGYS